MKGDQENKDALTQSQAFFEECKKPIIIAVVILVVIIVGALPYKAYVSKPRAERTSTELGKDQQYFGEGDYEKTLDGDKIKHGDFVKVVSNYGSTDAGNLANFHVGLCYISLGKWKEAVKYLNEYNGANGAMVSPAVLATFGNACAYLNQLGKAVENLKKVAKKTDSKEDDGANSSLSSTFLMQTVKILESQNKKSDVLTMYQGIKRTYVSSAVVQSREIGKYIERASR